MRVNDVMRGDDPPVNALAEVPPTEDEESAVAPYERGTVSIKDVARGVLLRFLPASAVSLFGVVLLTLAPGNPIGPMLGVLGRWTGWIGVGFALGLLVMRPWLYPDARVTGVRSVLSGFLGALLPLAFLRAQLGLVLPLEMNLVLLTAGAGVALAMFFPWLTPTPIHMRQDDTEELPEAGQQRPVEQIGPRSGGDAPA